MHKLAGRPLVTATMERTRGNVLEECDRMPGYESQLSSIREEKV